MRAWLAALLRTTADHLQPPQSPVTFHVTDVDAVLRKWKAQRPLTFTVGKGAGGGGGSSFGSAIRPR